MDSRTDATVSRTFLRKHISPTPQLLHQQLHKTPHSSLTPSYQAGSNLLLGTTILRYGCTLPCAIYTFKPHAARKPRHKKRMQRQLGAKTLTLLRQLPASPLSRLTRATLQQHQQDHTPRHAYHSLGIWESGTSAMHKKYHHNAGSRAASMALPIVSTPWLMP